MTGREIVYDRPGMEIELYPSWVEGGRFDLILFPAQGANLTLQFDVTEAEARAAAVAVGDLLAPLFFGAAQRAEARLKQRLREGAEQAERERPERERRERELRAKLQAAEKFEAAKCEECGHIDEPDEFDVPAYECSTCGGAGIGEDGRRCPTCHRFAAKVSTQSCPNCEAPLPDGTVTVKAALVDGVWYGEEVL